MLLTLCSSEPSFPEFNNRPGRPYRQLLFYSDVIPNSSWEATDRSAPVHIFWKVLWTDTVLVAL